MHIFPQDAEMEKKQEESREVWRREFLRCSASHSPPQPLRECAGITMTTGAGRLVPGDSLAPGGSREGGKKIKHHLHFAHSDVILTIIAD